MAVDRRGFLRSGAAGAAGVVLAGAGCAPGGGPDEADAPSRFRHGVASGDPWADRVILWTRVTPRPDERRASVGVAWWIARDAEGRDVVRRGRAHARPDRNHTVKVDADGLAPGETYHYGFSVGEGRRRDASPVGRTKTLPAADVDRVRLAFASCSNLPFGFFNGYANLARRDDVDVVLHLGDYLYEYENGEYGDGTALGRVPAPDREIVSLDDYRLRHAQYKADPDLQAAHARHPWITVWDDHESANNAHRDGAQNHSPETEGDWRARRLAAIRAYYEWMPIRELPTGLFRSFRFGGLLDLVMLDTRLHGRDPAPPRERAAAEDPARSMLGADQTRWLLDALDASKRAGSRWRVIGQQVIVSPVAFDAENFNPDAWDGYRANRRQLLDHLRRASIRDVVFLTGDVHSSWVFDVPAGDGTPYDPATGAGAVAVEFVTPAISSPAIGAIRDVSERLRALERHTPHVRHRELTRNGYAILDLDHDRARVEFVYSDPVDRRSATAHPGAVYEVRAGTPHAVRADG